MTARTTRLLLDVPWDPAVEDKPTTWRWDCGIDSRPSDLPIVVVGEVTGRDDELLTVLEELRDRVERAYVDATGCSRIAPGMSVARRMVQDAINEHTPEPPDLDGEDLFPARPVSHRDAITAGCLEATRD